MKNSNQFLYQYIYAFETKKELYSYHKLNKSVSTWIKNNFFYKFDSLHTYNAKTH